MNPSIPSRALATLAIGIGALLFAACTPTEEAAWQALFEAYQAEQDMIAERTAGGPSDATLARLRYCESTNNYQAVSRTGKYRGAYQFSRTTWNATAQNFLDAYVGVDPAASPNHIQDAMAKMLWKTYGSGQWPVCGPRAA